jgi:hypothetical protein
MSLRRIKMTTAVHVAIAHAPQPATTGRVGPPVDHRPEIPAQSMPQRSPQDLLRLARCGLAEAAVQTRDGLRYASAHLAALRAAAAVVAARAKPVPMRRNRITSVWTLLTLVSPELGEWAAFFAQGATKRAAAEAGIARAVTQSEADDLLRAAEQFVGLVEVALAAYHQPSLLDLAS